MALERSERRRTRRVARDDDQLGALPEEVIGDLDREPLELLLRALAVREASRIAEVEVILGRQRHEQLVQHGEPADAGIEYGDGLRRGSGHRGPWCQSHQRTGGSLGRRMRALIVTNMYPSPEAPARGSFVRDQVRALERIDDVQLELFTFEPGGGRPYGRAIAEVRRQYRGRRFDVVHSHFGLTAWPAFAVRADVHALTMHGNDLVHPRSRAITLAALPLLDIPAVVSSQFADRVPGWVLRKPLQVLPCGVATDRFRPIPRAEARARLGLDPDGRYLLFPHDPGRPVKRFEDARRSPVTLRCSRWVESIPTRSRTTSTRSTPCS